MGWRGMLRDLQYRPLARVVKLVDTGDLKSPDHCDRAGSSPAPGTTRVMTPCRLGSGEGGRLRYKNASPACFYATDTNI